VPEPRITVQTQAVLAVLLSHGVGEAGGVGDLDERGESGARSGEPEEMWGFEISRTSGLPAGTIYPILQRLTAAGWVEDRWEDPVFAREHKRPPRRYYRLTVSGRARAVHALGQAATSRAALAKLLGTRPGPQPGTATP
jgi:PadR family transcriptional regulator, regulatory protein PadR